MGGVGHEAALLGHGGFGAAQQAVDGGDEGQQLTGQVLMGQGLQVVVGALVYRAGKRSQWTQHQVQDEQDQAQQQGHEQGNGQGGVEGAVAGDFVTDAGVLGNGNALAALAVDVDAVSVAPVADEVVAVLQIAGQWQAEGVAVFAGVLPVTGLLVQAQGGRCGVGWGGICGIRGMGLGGWLGVIIIIIVIVIVIVGFPVTVLRVFMCVRLVASRCIGAGGQALDDQAFFVVVGEGAALGGQVDERGAAARLDEAGRLFEHFILEVMDFVEGGVP